MAARGNLVQVLRRLRRYTAAVETALGENDAPTRAFALLTSDVLCGHAGAPALTRAAGDAYQGHDAGNS